MAVIPARADHQSTSIETGGRGFQLLIHARFFIVAGAVFSEKQRSDVNLGGCGSVFRAMAG
jgi:hypothetical protein